MRRFLFQTLLMVWTWATSFAWMVVIIFTISQTFSGTYALWLLAALILPWFRLVINWIFPRDTFGYDPDTSIHNKDVALKDVTLRTFCIGLILLIWMLTIAFAWKMVFYDFVTHQVSESSYLWLLGLFILFSLGLVVKRKYPKGIFYDRNAQK